MHYLICLLVLLAHPAQAAELRKTSVAMGLSRVIDTDFDIGEVEVIKGKSFTFRKVDVNGKVRQLVLIALKPGTGKIAIQNTNGAVKQELTVETVKKPAEIKSVITDMKRDASDRGEQVKEIQISKGSTQEITAEFVIGPIYVGDATRVHFTRLDGGKKIRLTARKAGLTDITLHDSSGARRQFLLVKVL